MAVIPALGESVAIGELELDLVGRETTMTPACPTALSRLRMSAPPVRPLSFQIPLKTRDVIILSEHQVLKDSLGSSTPAIETSTSYPFALFLPAGMAPTMECIDSETGGWCAVNYTLTATAVVSVIRDGEITDSTVCMHTAKSHRGLRVIGEPMSAVKYPHVARPSCFHVKQSLFQKGHITVTARSENTHVSKDGSVDLTLAIVNKTPHNIDRAEVSLIEKVSWSNGLDSTSCSHGSKHGGRFDVDCKIELQSHTNWLPFGLQAEHIPGASFGLKASTPSQQELYKVDELMHEERNQTTIHVPQTARASYQGQLIHVLHCIQVILAVQGISPLNYPKLCIPIVVFDPPIRSTCNAHHPVQGVIDISMT